MVSVLFFRLGSDGNGAQQCYSPSMVVKLYFVPTDSKVIIAKGNTVSYRLNGNEVANLDDGKLTTSYPNQIFHLENTKLGLKLLHSDGKLDIRGQWSARVMEAGNANAKHGFSENVAFEKLTYGKPF